MVDRRTGAKKMEMWSADDEGRPAPAFAAPTDRPAARRPAETQRRRADDAAGAAVRSPVQTEPPASVSTASPETPSKRSATARPAPVSESRPMRPATRRPADPERSKASPPDTGRGDPQNPDGLDAAEVEPSTEFRWPKQSDEPENDKEDLSADSPLLSRAFRAAK